VILPTAFAHQQLGLDGAVRVAMNGATMWGLRQGL